MCIGGGQWVVEGLCDLFMLWGRAVVYCMCAGVRDTRRFTCAGRSAVRMPTAAAAAAVGVAGAFSSVGGTLRRHFVVATAV